VRLMSIDPGSIRCGFAIMDYKDSRLKLVSSGTILMNEKSALPERLLELAEDIDALLQKFKPTTLSLESIFFSQNARSAIQLGQARGVILLKAAEYSLDIHEYSPAEIKKSVVGHGRASKDQIEKMIRLLLKLPHTFEFKSADHSDAIAIGLAHLQLFRTKKGKNSIRDCTSFWETHF